RVAEGLLHEAMHLQLTLVEAVVPLTSDSASTYFSPWRNEHRTAQGVMHALYVFRVIDAFLAEILMRDATPANWCRHASGRRAEIAGQMDDVRSFRACADLTPDGRRFVDRLLG